MRIGVLSVLPRLLVQSSDPLVVEGDDSSLRYLISSANWSGSSASDGVFSPSGRSIVGTLGGLIILPLLCVCRFS